MPHSDSTSKLPKWPFLAGDAALLGTAWLIAENSPHPYPPEMTLAIVACVVVATIAGAIPFLSDYARRQDEALDERQRALESLSQTVTSAAEQIGIAVRGFQELSEQAQKNLQQAESLPQKKAAAARDEEKEELKKELAARRVAEAERIEAAADKVAQAATEWIRLESASQKHLAAAKSVLAELDEKVARTKAQPRAKPAPPAAPSAPARVESAAAPVPETAEISKAVADFQAVEPPAPLKPEEVAAIVIPPPLPIEAPSLAEGLAPSQEPPLPIGEPTAPVAAPAADAAPAEALPAETPAPAAPSSDAVPAAVASPKPPRKRAPRKPPAETPPSEVPASTEAPAETPVNGTPPAEIAAKETEPAAAAANGEPATEMPAKAAQSAEALAKAEAPRLEQPSLEFSQTADDEAAPTAALASDGATRLLVTAYIGIGNRLFVRGDGPGLSWERGVPLQFVSIGKWKWESADAAAPVHYKLYKNDVTECTSLTNRPLDPGHQQEVTATF